MWYYFFEVINLAMEKAAVKEEIAKNLAFFRKKSCMTQKELGKLLGVRDNTITQWEKGVNSIDVEMLFKACDIFGISINDIYGKYANITRKVDLTKDEFDLLESYRNQPHLQEPVKRFLGMPKEENNVVKIDTLNKPKELTLISEQIRAVSVQKIPLLGKVSAGQPILAEEDFECYFEVDADIKCDFCLHVNGDSMINARINDGDIVFIRQQPDVNDGEIGVVLIDDEATLKRVYKNNGSITLVAENTKYKPIVISGKDAIDVRILGKAVAFQSDVK